MNIQMAFMKSMKLNKVENNMNKQKEITLDEFRTQIRDTDIDTLEEIKWIYYNEIFPSCIDSLVYNKNDNEYSDAHDYLVRKRLELEIVEDVIGSINDEEK